MKSSNEFFTVLINSREFFTRICQTCEEFVRTFHMCDKYVRILHTCDRGKTELGAKNVNFIDRPEFGLVLAQLDVEAGLTGKFH